MQPMFETAIIKTPICVHCHKSSEVTVPKLNYLRWQSGMYIQEAFPEMPVDQRELLQTGIHPECWKILFEEEK